MTFTCWDSTEPIRCDVCDVYVGCEVWVVGLLRLVLLLASWSAISLPKILVSALTNFVLLCCVWSIESGGLWLR